MTGFSRSEWSGMIGTAGALSVPGLVEDLHTTCFFDQFKCPGVVVIGVVNRGKSTLVNELIGESIAPQAFTPETATLLGITNQPGNRPSGFTKSGSLKILPSNPKRFSKWLRRGSKIQMASAIFPLASQLPENLVLVDTPGVEEVESSASVAALVHSTKRAMSHASGAIVVLGVPGVKGSDMLLVRESIETYGRDKTMVVIKANDSSVVMTDVQAWKEELGFDASFNVALLVDSDKSQMARISTFLHEMSRLNFNPSKHGHSVAATTERLLVAIPKDKPLHVRPGIRRRAPERIREALDGATPRRIRKRLKEEAKEKKRQEKFRKVELRRSYDEAVVSWENRDAMFQRRIDACSSTIAQCKASVAEAQRVHDSLIGGLSRFWHGDGKRQEQLLRIEQNKSRLDLAYSEYSEARNAKRQHELERPKWSRWVIDR
jgi:hypothetical protein